MDRGLPNETGKRYIAWCGAETDVIFNRGIDLPGFAFFPLLEEPQTRAMMLDYALRQIKVASQRGFGTILESSTWVASRDRAPDGYGAERLAVANRDAIALLDEARAKSGASDVVISAVIGPRSDGYNPDSFMTADEAQEYHAEQLGSLRDTAADLITGYTITYAEEAIGIVRAAAAMGFAVVISLTVEIDGQLPNGQSLNDAIDEIDRETGGVVSYFMVNCAHPDHFSDVLTGHPRLRGVVVNASRCSHAELDEAVELDGGDPAQLGGEVAELIRVNPAMIVFGGCCGTDFRHLDCMAKEVAEI